MGRVFGRQFHFWRKPGNETADKPGVKDGACQRLRCRIIFGADDDDLDGAFQQGIGGKQPRLMRQAHGIFCGDGMDQLFRPLPVIGLTGGVAKHWFARKHDTILYYAKNRGGHTFHVQREGWYRTDGLRRDETGRPYKSTTQGRVYFNGKGPAMTDVWEIPFLSTVALERTGYPSQKPLALLKRIVVAGSNVNDVVADFFCGSGTTLAAAQQLGRRWLGCDMAPEAIRITSHRLGLEAPQRALV